MVQVWCLASSVEQENQINRTVDGAVLSILLTGLLPEVRYSVMVAAVTSLGVGAQSSPVSLLLSESLTATATTHRGVWKEWQMKCRCGMLIRWCEKLPNRGAINTYCMFGV